MPELKRFKLNISQHSDTDPHTKVNTIYVVGDVFDSDKDLIDLNRAGNPKFSEVSAGTPMRYAGHNGQKVVPLATRPGDVPPPNNQLNPKVVQAGSDTFDGMSTDELKRHAADEEINLGKAKSREEILAVLRKHG